MKSKRNNEELQNTIIPIILFFQHLTVIEQMQKLNQTFLIL